MSHIEGSGEPVFHSDDADSVDEADVEQVSLLKSRSTGQHPETEHGCSTQPSLV